MPGTPSAPLSAGPSSSSLPSLGPCVESVIDSSLMRCVPHPGPESGVAPTSDTTVPCVTCATSTGQSARVQAATTSVLQMSADDALETATAEVARPDYDRDKISVGIVHIGVGGFHRAHQALAVDRLLRRGEAYDWGICGVGLLPG